MWLFTRYGFFSISIDKDDNLWVRARCLSHLERLQERFNLNGSPVHWAGTDYAWRLGVDRKEWEQIMSELAKEQTWSNFKNEAYRFNKSDLRYISALHDIWSVMYNLQLEQE